MMRHAKLFNSINGFTRTLTKKHLQIYGATIQKGWNSKTKILDLGCGDGAVTKLLTSHFPKAQWYACDISLDMLKFAQKNNGDLGVKFFHLDIRKDVKEELKAKFDGVFSCFVLHRIHNQRVAISNINSLLKPKGRCLFSIMGDNEIYDMDRRMSKKPKWSQYIRDVEQLISPYHEDEHPEQSLKKVMLECGFRDVFATTRQLFWHSNDTAKYRTLIKSVDPCLAEIPLELHEEYVEDYFTLLANDGQKSPPYSVPYTVLEVIAHK